MADSPIIDPKTGNPMDTSGVKNIVGDDQLRAKQAAEEIRVILEAYDAELFPVIMLSPRGVVGTSVDVLPKKRAEMPLTPQDNGAKEAIKPLDAGDAGKDAEVAGPSVETPDETSEPDAKVIDLKKAVKISAVDKKADAAADDLPQDEGGDAK
jgi:hypothetical protein